MVDIEEVECEFCGAIIPLSKAVKIDLETGGYKYACPNCAIKWKRKTTVSPKRTHNPN